MHGARRWYDEQHPGLGAEFLRSVEATFARIQRSPDLYPVVDEEVRRAPVRRFPFAIYYEIEPNQIVTYAVWHYRRDPRIWQQRAR
jgi:plasmid stabilization system protein ParE